MEEYTELLQSAQQGRKAEGETKKPAVSLYA